MAVGWDIALADLQREFGAEWAVQRDLSGMYSAIRGSGETAIRVTGTDPGDLCDAIIRAIRQGEAAAG